MCRVLKTAEKRERVVKGFNQKLEIIKRLMKSGESANNVAQTYGVGRKTGKDVKRVVEKIK